VSLGGMAWNLAWVTLGNIVGGAVFVAGAYRAASPARAGLPVQAPAAIRDPGARPALDTPAARS